jgi:hypothetical protein
MIIYKLSWFRLQCVPKFLFATISETWYPRARRWPSLGDLLLEASLVLVTVVLPKLW